MTVKTKMVGKCVVDKCQVFKYMIYHTDSEACTSEAKANNNMCASHTHSVPSIQTMSSSSYKISMEQVKSLPLSLSHAKCSDHFIQSESQTFNITNITQNELECSQSRIPSLCMHACMCACVCARACVCVGVSVGVQGCWL